MKNTNSNIKTGAFVMAGLIVTIIAFYLIGQNKNTWAGGRKVIVYFSQLNGLKKGNDVLYSGMPAGSVDNIEIKNDTTIQVTLLVDKKISPYIHQNAIASISSEGLMGNMVVNLSPAPGQSQLIIDGTVLAPKQAVNVEQLMTKLGRINDNVLAISEVFKDDIKHLHAGGILQILRDTNTSIHLKSAIVNFDQTTQNTAMATRQLNALVSNISSGKSTMGILLKDTAAANDTKAILKNLKLASNNVNQLSLSLEKSGQDLNKKLNDDKGTIGVLLNDTAVAANVKKSISNIAQGTNGFNQNMEALKHNFLFKGYFTQKAKEQAKANQALQKNADQ